MFIKITLAVAALALVLARPVELAQRTVEQAVEAMMEEVEEVGLGVAGFVVGRRFAGEVGRQRAAGADQADDVEGQLDPLFEPAGALVQRLALDVVDVAGLERERARVTKADRLLIVGAVAADPRGLALELLDQPDRHEGIVGAGLGQQPSQPGGLVARARVHKIL